MASGLGYLAGMFVVHRNLSIDVCGVTHDLRIKIRDLRLGRVVDEQQLYYSSALLGAGVSIR